jgi:hypothetical protein
VIGFSEGNEVHGYVYAEGWGAPDGTEVEMSSKPTYTGADGSEWVTHQTVRKDGGVGLDGVLHKDSYEPLVDQHGRPIPPPHVLVAPVASRPGTDRRPVPVGYSTQVVVYSMLCFGGTHVAS